MQLGHIGLNVTELDRSVRFYSEVLGFTLRTRSDETGKKFALLGDDRKNLVTLWQQSEGTFSPQLPGLHHLAFEVDSVEIVKSFEEKLKAHGIPFIYEGMVAHVEGADSGGIYFEDPDGFRLEIYTLSGVSGHSCSPTTGRACGFF
ncbi:VOC family protein [Paenibacillus sp. SI8]|uniref:VOC family protein n=1 Tax=unclassified Paenibacillus TaxID=185978 RepID=UPI0034653C05